MRAVHEIHIANKPDLRVLGHPDQLTVLKALKLNGPQRFSELEKATRLNPAQVDRALKTLRKGLYVFAKTTDSKEKRILVMYHLAPRGEKILAAWRAAERVLIA